MEKKYQHMALVRRDEVVELFKNGIIYPLSCITFTGDLLTLAKDSKAVAKLFDKYPAIEYSIHYFLLHAATSNKCALNVAGLRASDLEAILPLDSESERMGLKLSPPVLLGAPIFAADFMDYQERVAVENAKKGIANIEQMFKKLRNEIKGKKGPWSKTFRLMASVDGFNEEDLNKLVAFILDESGRWRPKTIWEFLLGYTRNQTYPSDIRGAFLDTMSVINNCRNGEIAFKDFKQGRTGKLIMDHPNPLYCNLVECCAESPNYVAAADAVYKDIWKIAPLYFMLLEKFSNVSEDGAFVGNTPIREYLASLVKHFDRKHLDPALLMVGIVLGQTSTYKMLYNVLKEDFHFLA